MSECCQQVHQQQSEHDLQERVDVELPQQIKSTRNNLLVVFLLCS